MSIKPFYRSRTFWINLIALAAFVAQAATDNIIISPEAQAAILTVLNLVLRFRTTEGVGL